MYIPFSFQFFGKWEYKLAPPFIFCLFERLAPNAPSVVPKMPRVARRHKSVKKTGMHADIEHTLYKSTIDEFAVRVTEKPEHLGLLEVGYE